MLPVHTAVLRQTDNGTIVSGYSILVETHTTHAIYTRTRAHTRARSLRHLIIPSVSIDNAILTV